MKHEETKIIQSNEIEFTIYLDNWMIVKLKNVKCNKVEIIGQRMNSRKLRKPILELEKWRVYMDGGILPLEDLLMEEEFTQRTFISFFKFQCFFFWQIFALWQQKEATPTMGFFWKNWL
jgi:hypothetical protein